MLGGVRGRLTLGIATVLAVVLAVAGAVVARDVDRSERQVLDDRLRRTAELSRATAVAAVEQELPDVDRRLDAVLRATRSSLRLAIGDQALLDSGADLPGHRRPPLGLHTMAVGGTRYRTYAETLRDPSLGGLVRLEVATSLADLEARQAALRRRLALLGAAMLLVAAAGTWLAADLVLRPLRRLRAAAAGIVTEGDLERPVPVGGPAELRALAGSFNAMLARLARSADDRNRALEEVSARLHALLRRRPPAATERLVVGDLELDPVGFTARRAGRDLGLTRREFELLELFLRHPGEVLDRRRLHEEIWRYTFDPGTNVTDVFVGYLRRKLEAEGEPRVLHTVRGVGFVLRV